MCENELFLSLLMNGFTTTTTGYLFLDTKPGRLAILIIIGILLLNK